MKPNQQREKVHGAKFWGNQVQVSKGLQSRSHTGCIVSPPVMSCDNTCEKCQPEKLIRDSAARVFIGSCKQPLPVTYQNCRLQK